ncbi:hypothetical protein ASF23_13740, partial [Curtobacterium sp. Leaf261]
MLAAVLASTVGIGGGLLAAVPANAAELHFPFATDFASADGGTLTGSAVVTDNKLRLTQAQTGQAGSWATDGVFPSSLGVDVSFSYGMYGGSGADGFVAYLADGAASQGVGAPGAGLGYSCAPSGGPSGPCTVAGVPGGYVGVGFDQFGNFSNALGNSGPGQRSNQVVVRGSGDGTAGYRYVTGVAAPGGSLSTGSATGARDVRITMQPDADGVLRLSVRSNTGPGTPMAVIIDNVAVSGAGQAALPPTLRLGFAGSTGGSTNVHEISAVRVAVPTDLSVTQDFPTSVAAGTDVRSTFTVRNHGQNAAPGAVVTSTVPAALQNVRWTCAPAADTVCTDRSGTGNDIRAAVDLPVGGSAEYTVTGTLPKTATGTLRSRVHVEAPADRADAEPDDNTVTSTARVVANTDVTTTKSAALLDGDAALIPGGDFEYTVTAKNQSTSPASDVAVHDTLPDGVSFVGSADQCTADGQDVTCTSATDLAAGADRSFTFRAHLAEGFTGGRDDAVNIATASASTDRDGGESSRPVPLPAPFQAAAPAGEVSAVRESAQLVPGGSVEYRVTVRNTGNVRLDDVAVGVSAGGTATCDTVTLGAGASTTCTSTATVTQDDIDAGRITRKFTAGATSPAGAAVALGSDSVTTTITAAPQGSSAIVSDAAGSEIVAGQEVGYTSTFSNTGNVTLSGLTVTATLGAKPSCSVATLAPGADATCTGSYRVTQADVDHGSIVQS